MSDFEIIKIDQQIPIEQQIDLNTPQCKYYFENYVLTQQIDEILNKKKDQKCQDKKNVQQQKEKGMQKSETSVEEKKIRFKNRRMAYQIDRKFECQYMNCRKSYGSETSLSYHMRVKHSVSNPNSVEEKTKQKFTIIHQKKSEMNQSQSSENNSSSNDLHINDHKFNDHSINIFTNDLDINDDLLQQELEKIQKNLDI